ncbi:phospholipid-translocating P-type ATPase [Gonapodya prolifera JEL478]|uniref:P-type phospholipid transporter n=1 Tax=Gonapodya prolifera (strain JEL478) TaxID=1344416 RepID=A0A139AT87_GONPJ|nr:phospholipid-translocating P-type ATPase [Gonapodya prolifera JEL478]|eukprot:KXS19904.1 phospholipid-translocating P-type ATPase [Gonapodya prolifera JEL478]
MEPRPLENGGDASQPPRSSNQEETFTRPASMVFSPQQSLATSSSSFSPRPSLSKDRSASGLKARHLVTFSGAEVVGVGASTDEEGEDEGSGPSSARRQRPGHSPRLSNTLRLSADRISSSLGSSHPSISPRHSYSLSGGGRFRNPPLLLDITSAIRGAAGSGHGNFHDSLTSSDRSSPRSPESPRGRNGEPEFTGSALRRPIASRHTSNTPRTSMLRRTSEPALSLPLRASVESSLGALSPRAPSPISPMRPQNEPLLLARESMASEASSGKRASAARNHPRYPSRGPLHPLTIFNTMRRHFRDALAPVLPKKTPFDFDFRVTARPFIDAFQYVFVGKQPKKERKLEPRRIFVNVEPDGEWADGRGGVKQRYPGNAVHTAKYSIVTFLPKNLLEQFRGLANFYFLALIILQTTPEFAVVNPIITALPLLFIICVTAVKDGIEDYNRHIQDKRLNETRTLTLYSTNAVEFTRPTVAGEPTTIEEVKVDPLFKPPPARYSSTLVADQAESHRGQQDRPPPAMYTNHNVPLVRTVGWADLNPIIWLENIVWFFAYIVWFLWSEVLYFWQLWRSHKENVGGSQQTLNTSGLQSQANSSQLDTDQSKDVAPNDGGGDMNGSSQIPETGDPQPTELEDETDEKRSMDGWGWAETMWQDVRVGDFVLLRNNQQIPADILILGSSEPEGACYLETKNLDGETNLKIRRAPLLALNSPIHSAESCLNVKLRVDVEAPSVNMYSVTGSLECEGEAFEVDTFESDQPTHDSDSPRPPKFDPVGWKRGKSLDLDRRGVRPTASTRGNAIRSQHLKALSTGSRALFLQPPQRREMKNDSISSSPAETEMAAVLDVPKERKGSVTASPTVLVPVSKTGFNLNNVLLRGCFLRNTGWVVGVVIYTGEDTKIIMNSGATPSKRSNIDQKMNAQVLINCMILLALCLIMTICHTIYTNAFNFEGAPWLIGEKGTQGQPAWQTAVTTFWQSMILFQSIIPISLYISIDLAKSLQALFIYYDEFMRYFFPDDGPDAEGVPCTPRSWNLSDDLGQIEYVFSDKTGTLTQNVMEFKRCSVAGVAYGQAPEMADESKGVTIAQVQLKEATIRASARKVMEELLPPNSRKYISTSAKYGDSQMWMDMIGDGLPKDWNIWEIDHAMGYPDRHDDPTYLRRRLIMFWMHLAISHTVLVEKRPAARQEDGNLLTQEVNYQASSPDEAALVSAARDSGFTFIRRKQDEILLDFMGTELTYKVLQVLEFSSDRKRMSVIVQTNTGLILLLCKGADSVIFERLEGSEGMDTLIREMKLYYEDETLLHLEQFASEGLRTLCVAYRILPSDYYETWSKKYSDACAAMNNRDALIEKAASEIESQLTLLGATAIEDKLQEGVPETIAKLIKGNIKVWVLTGDKIETAINIAFSCSLLSRDQQLLVVRGGSSVVAVRKVLLAGLRDVWDPDGDFALVIDGESLRHALDKSNQILFLELACRCRSVVCCRVSPLQKAQVVKLVRRNLGAMCLSIGDGANDVSMIQEADIGVGIVGREGMQAAVSADYSFGQFRYLQRLLLVHGRWCYMRTAEMVLGFFYKNVVLLFIAFWYQFYCGFSAGDSFDFYYGMFYQTFFTFVPNFLLGVVDQDVNDRIALDIPYLYRRGIRQEEYTMERFWSFMGDGMYQSVVIFFFTLALLEDSAPDMGGLVPDQAMMSGIFAWTVIINVNIFMLLNFKSWSWVAIVGYLVTLAFWFAFCFVYWNVPDAPAYGMMFRLLGMPSFWFHYVLITVVGFAPRYISKFVRQTFFPSDAGIFREIQKFHIQSPELRGVDVWSSDDLKELFRSRRLQGHIDVSSLDAAEGVPSQNSSSSLELIPKSADGEEAWQHSAAPTGSSSSREMRRKSVGSAFNAKRMSSMVFLHQPDYEYAFTGFGFSQDEGAGDTVTHNAAQAENTNVEYTFQLRTPLADSSTGDPFSNVRVSLSASRTSTSTDGDVVAIYVSPPTIERDTA